MRIDIIGAGAIGLLFAAGLGAEGNHVRLWTRTEEQASLINKHGIRIKHDDGTEQTIRKAIRAVPFTQSMVEQEGASSDFNSEGILLTVKQRHLTDDFLRRLSILNTSHVSILCLQNGMGHLDRIAEYLPPECLFAAVTTEGAKRLEGNSIVRSKPGQTSIGTLMSGGGDSSVLENLAVNLSKAGFQVSVSKEIEKEIHRKLLINAAINPLTALWRIPNGELLAANVREELLDRLIHEGVDIYRAAGIPFDQDISEQIKNVCRSTSSNISSMLTDVLNGTETEVDYINGYLVQLADKLGMTSPAHEIIWRLVKGLLPSR